MVRKIIVIGITFLLIISCSKEEEVNLGFLFDVTGYAPNAVVEIYNLTENASSYSWIISEGASIETSNEKDLKFTADKVGELSITLIALNGNSRKELTQVININGYNAILTYENLEFALSEESQELGCLYSFDTERMYKPSEVNEENASMIHLGFGSMSNAMYFFLSPTDDWFSISETSETKVINYESTPSISVDDFDAIEDDAKLSVLTITGTNDSFGNSEIPGTVLFELASGKKGVVKIKAVNSDRILVDIKIQKYQ